MSNRNIQYVCREVTKKTKMVGLISLQRDKSPQGQL